MRQVELEHVRRDAHRRVDVAELCVEWAATLPGTSGVHEVLRRAGRLDADDGRQRPVLDDDPLGGVLGEVAVTRDHHRDRLADVVDLVAWPARTACGRGSASGCGISSGSGSASRPGRSS